MNEKPTVQESIEQLTGYDELAIEKHFGADLDSLRFTMQVRALVFVQETNGGANATEAKKTAMASTIKALNDRFSDDPDELDDEDTPVTPAGPIAGEGATTVE